MSEPAQNIPERVTKLENEMAEVRYLANKTDRDVSDVHAALRGQTGVLNAIGESQREHGQMLAQHGKRLERLESKVDGLDRKFDTGFHKLKVGQDHITSLLNTMIKKSDETDGPSDGAGG